MRIIPKEIYLGPGGYYGTIEVDGEDKIVGPYDKVFKVHRKMDKMIKETHEPMVENLVVT